MRFRVVGAPPPADYGKACCQASEVGFGANGATDGLGQELPVATVSFLAFFLLDIAPCRLRLAERGKTAWRTWIARSHPPRDLRGRPCEGACCTINPLWTAAPRAAKLTIGAQQWI
jgi:hypothetical protein